MREPGEGNSQADSTRKGFVISRDPVLPSIAVEAPGVKSSAPNFAELPERPREDLFYVIARDPSTLFLYWELNWKNLFNRAGILPRQVHLRTYGANGALRTDAIDPFKAHCYIDVPMPDTEYYCELGAFEDDEWIPLIRSASTRTPANDFATASPPEFATLPLHLRFERLLEFFESTEAKGTLAEEIAARQEEARQLRATMSDDEWSRLLVADAAERAKAGIYLSEAETAELKALLDSTSSVSAELSEQEVERLRKMSARMGTSWSGGAWSDYGGSPPGG